MIVLFLVFLFCSVVIGTITGFVWEISLKASLPPAWITLVGAAYLYFFNEYSQEAAMVLPYLLITALLAAITGGVLGNLYLAPRLRRTSPLP